MDSSLYRIFELALRPGHLPLEPLLCRATAFFTRGLIVLLLIQLIARFGTPLQRTLIPLATRTLIDSGSTFHICHDRSKLLNYRPYHVPLTVVGAGGCAWILGKGDMEITTVIKEGENATRRETLYLYGVRYVPRFGVTVLSTEQLRLQGIFYSSEKAVLYRRQGSSMDVVGETDVSDGAPRLKTVEEKPIISPSSSPRRSWYDKEHWSFLLSWSWWSQHVLLAKPTHEDVVARISKLEKDNDELAITIDVLKQANAGLEYSLSFRLQSDRNGFNRTLRAEKVGWKQIQSRLLFRPLPEVLLSPAATQYAGKRTILEAELCLFGISFLSSLHTLLVFALLDVAFSRHAWRGRMFKLLQNLKCHLLSSRKSSRKLFRGIALLLNQRARPESKTLIATFLHTRLSQHEPTRRTIPCPAPPHQQ
jgi:hypothetical protein